MGKKRLDQEALDIQSETKKLSARKIRFRANCTHVKDNGKPRIQPSRKNEYVFTCNRCNSEIDLRSYTQNRQAGLDNLNDAVDEVCNALEIIKYRAALDETNGGSGKKSKQLIEYSANLLIELPKVPEIIEALLDQGKNKEEKKEKRRRELRLGLSGLSFGGGGDGKKKKKGW